MRSKLDEQLLVALQQTVSSALRQWLSKNKGEALQMVRKAVFEGQTANQERQQQQTRRSEFLTVAEVARRWQLHPESVRRMIRQRRISAAKVGRYNRVVLGAVEKFEQDGPGIPEKFGLARTLALPVSPLGNPPWRRIPPQTQSYVRSPTVTPPLPHRSTSGPGPEVLR
jgi:excisionase family DNA binding protein